MFFGAAIPGFDTLFDEQCTKEGLINFLRVNRGVPSVPLEAPDRVAVLLERLGELDGGVHTLIGHPAYDTPEMRELSHEGLPGSLVAASRNWERRFFVDPRVKSYVRENGIIPIRYDEAVVISDS